MAHDSENAQSRLSNIEAVVPILGALRTISLGNWQSALKRRSGLAVYTEGLLNLLPSVLSKLLQTTHEKHFRFPRKKHLTDVKAATGLVYAYGSERGLCGRYNRILADKVQDHVNTALAEDQFGLKVVGARLERALRSLDDAPEIDEFIPSSLTGMPSYGDAVARVRDWLGAYERGELDFVDLVYNANAGSGQYEPYVLRLLPPDVTSVIPTGADIAESEDDWTIIDTDPLALLVHIIEQWTSITLYQVMLEAVATEHAARYQLMEAASRNADDLVEDLTLAIQSSRRQAITREMQELAAGAGLVG